MKIVTKEELNHYPAGTVFAEYKPDIILSDVMVIDPQNFIGEWLFGATDVVPQDGEVFDWDWSLGEYKDNDLFAVFEKDEIFQMVQTLISGLKILE